MSNSTDEPTRSDQGSGSQAADREPQRGGGSGGGGRYHPFVEGLLATLPEPGTVWAIEGRAAWLEAAASAFKLLYQGDGRITVKSEAETKIASR